MAACGRALPLAPPPVVECPAAIRLFQPGAAAAPRQPQGNPRVAPPRAISTAPATLGCRTGRRGRHVCRLECPRSTVAHSRSVDGLMPTTTAAIPRPSAMRTGVETAEYQNDRKVSRVGVGHPKDAGPGRGRGVAVLAWQPLQRFDTR